MRRIVGTSLLTLALLPLLSGCGLFGKKKNAEMTATEYPTVYQEPVAAAPTYSTQPSYDTYNAGAGAATAYPTTNMGGGGRTHTVARKETLYSIARQYYGGDQSRWRDIYEANRGELPDPNRIRVGQRLVIP